MKKTEKLHVAMSLAPTWLSGDGWRRQDSNVESLFGSDFYLSVAKKAEAAHLDFVFCPDTQFIKVDALEQGAGFASLDPNILLASLFRETSKIGFLTTLSTTFYPPYILARQLQSLNWLSGGRIGWNIVTALDGHANFGMERLPSADDRYAQAAEFVDLVKKLWSSFPNEALVLDRESGHYADTGLVRPVAHSGAHHSVQGPLGLPAAPSPIPLVQAGASVAGRNFAASIADAVFASTPDKAAARELRQDLQARAQSQGRSPEAIRVLPGLSLYLADSKKEAQELFAETHARASRQKAVGKVIELIGLDLTDWSDDRAVRANDLPAPLPNPRSRTHSDLLRRLVEREELTVRELLSRPEVIGSAHWQVIGTVDEAFEAVRDWHREEAIDGFICVPGGSVDCMSLALEQLMPQLSEEGLLRRNYDSDSFMGHLSE
ncbi:NtaA/DmoA family FMN-dependent monooxygenase [Kiloniella sp. b19]|uniref:NtaA/DmoA family FMN-dependent monooxygenase n=1 Tax=Kiloniella sp. GXU_MW_B19 TaxID=3141326 RepID=UPI0031D637B3